MIPIIKRSKYTDTDRFHSVLTHLDEQASDCEWNYAGEIGTEENAPTPKENEKENDSQVLFLKGIWSPLDSLGVRFQQMEI